MSHLHPERLAALADSDPTAAESTHLASCASCAREIAAHRRLLLLAWQERERLAAPLSPWESLAEAARDEGLIRGPVTTGRMKGWGWVQAAAAVVLVAGGIAIGRQSAPVDAFDVATSGDSPALIRTVAEDDTTIAFRSTAEAISVLARAEREYRMAMVYLSGQDSVARVVDDPDIYRARLAALDEMAGVALDAVRHAPADPMMNRYYLNALSARDATLRQLGEKLPANVQLVGF
jgi:hypothetical protein